MPASASAEHHASLRVAMLVATGAAPEEVLAAITEALDVEIRRGEPAGAGVPIVVDGKPWGVIAGAVEASRLAEFAELAAAAIANHATREQLARLADEQTALRRVATLVARGAPPADVFDAVAEELGRLLGVSSTGLVRFEDEATVTVVAGWGRPVEAGARLSAGGMSLVSEIARTGRPARLDAAIGGPIMVAGRLWGAMIAAAAEGDPLPPDAEPRLDQFGELIGTAISNAEAGVEISRLADEHAALRRVATLVAEESAELFDKVVEELAGVLGAAAAIVRFEPPAQWGERAQEEIACPILVHGRAWGEIRATRTAGAEPCVARFAELVATAIANAAARSELQRLADEQASLRRMATLVAEAAAPTDVFHAAIEEVARLLGASKVGMQRTLGPNEIMIVAQSGQDPALVPVGLRLPLTGDSVTSRVLRSGRSTRLNLWEEGEGEIAELARRSNCWATVGAPITVEGRVWGVITASWEPGHLPPDDSEARLAQFAQLVGTAVANADTHDQLKASRARVLSAGDEARRHVVRDLHDGAQQRLVHTIISLKLAQRAVGTDDLEPLVSEALEHAERGNAELRELAHGILPSVLTHGGLRAGIDALVSRIALPVTAEIGASRLAPEIEASAYFIVAEALTNVVKHARATSATVIAVERDGALIVEVRDDGAGGADPEGTGLVGIADRVAALGGRMRIESPPDGGTLLAAVLPLRD